MHLPPGHSGRAAASGAGRGSSRFLPEESPARPPLRHSPAQYHRSCFGSKKTVPNGGYPDG